MGFLPGGSRWRRMPLTAAAGVAARLPSSATFGECGGGGDGDCKGGDVAAVQLGVDGRVQGHPPLQHRHFYSDPGDSTTVSDLGQGGRDGQAFQWVEKAALSMLFACTHVSSTSSSLGRMG
ncbi:hypothetical protein G6O67_006438 [Ophiocordyceps sinensis]|uniref:Uncharacterized protein n=1 Tax=Ophiocordyceps sinensis TaxID=72228 RepID=A0A8H4LWT4_9HYPO|nr:hypothetical protein G6O67_006438 [Ophiocordyceps sinensis]